MESVNPEDRERYTSTINAAWEQAGACSQEYRVLRKDGRTASSSFPLLPNRIRRVVIPWDGAGVPTTIRLALQGFTIETPLGNASQVAGDER